MDNSVGIVIGEEGVRGINGNGKNMIEKRVKSIKTSHNFQEQQKMMLCRATLVTVVHENFREASQLSLPHLQLQSTRKNTN